MIAHVLQPTLKRGLAIVGKAVASRYHLPVLGHVLLRAVPEADGGPYIALSATDLELHIACKLFATVERSGAFTVPARLLTDLVATLPPERIDLEVGEQGDALHLACGDSAATIRGLPADVFPQAHTMLPSTIIGTFAPDVLARAVGSVTFAAADDESRPVLTGALFHAEEDALTLVTVDGFRLAVCRSAFDEPLGQPVREIVPAGALAELSRLLAEEEHPVQLSLDETTARFALAGGAGANEGAVLDIEITSQLINGNFVNWRQIVPQSHSTQMTVDVEAFTRLCKTASVFARREVNQIALDVGDSANSQAVTVEASSVEMGDYVAEMPARIEGDALRVSLNVGYLLEALGTVRTERAVFTFNGEASPIKLTDGTDDLVHVIMPMHVRG